MVFNKNSGLVKNVWVPLILSGVYTKDQVPALGNLKEVVESVLADIQ
ncbi:hypothetical protein [Tissierella creatinophila]|uniref:Uncharacterized protein n=1 Tax=Tissierella creatinophila DSM 6911 TaxID=1123403 RepID=A0A1U7M4L0_TISCR|nr:hypothetical protein [Tissierella creatinophila]OLS02252.1 hypothetical protein TICRE_16380 [Tissierella creatinophila DSM 6911]